MMRSVFAGVSGLKNHQTRMDVIGNNISNVNTTGFKSSRVTFVDALSQTMSGAASPKTNIGGTNPKQVGLGSSVGSIDLMFQDGSVQSTGKNTDLCITGNGLFVVKNGNETYYTRDGAFEFDAEGNYVLPGSGLFVQGWMGNNGVVDTTTAVGNIQVAAGKSMEAKPTNLVTYANNLNANTPMIVHVGGGTVVPGKNVPQTGVVPGSSLPSGATESNGTIIYPSDTDYYEWMVVSIGGKEYNMAQSLSELDMSKTWTVAEDVSAGTGSQNRGTRVKLESSDGNTADIILCHPHGALTAGSEFSIDMGRYVLSSAVKPETPLEVVIDGKSYYVTDTVTWDIMEPHTISVTPTVGSSVLTVSWTGLYGKTVSTDITLSEPLTADNLPQAGQLVTVSAGRQASPEKPVDLELSDGSNQVQVSGTYSLYNSMPLTTTITAYDSLGKSHEIPVYFVREGEMKDGVINSTNKWLVSLEPNSFVTKGQSTTYEIIETDGTKTMVTMPVAEIQFTSSGKLVTTGSSDVNAIANITFTSGPIGTDGTNPGVPETQQLMIDFTALTQYAGNNTINGTSDGNASGTLKEIQIDTSGIITGVYTNGVRQAEAQVAIAQFTNATGLTKTGNSLYQESNNSGQANVKTAADLGVTITPSALEMSNVDVANEFADMIVTQRGFQSNSKIVTVGDEMLETIINMKR